MVPRIRSGRDRLTSHSVSNRRSPLVTRGGRGAIIYLPLVRGFRVQRRQQISTEGRGCLRYRISVGRDGVLRSGAPHGAEQRGADSAQSRVTYARSFEAVPLRVRSALKRLRVAHILTS